MEFLNQEESYNSTDRGREICRDSERWEGFRERTGILNKGGSGEGCVNRGSGSGRGIRIRGKGIGMKNGGPAPGGKMPCLGANSHLASGPNPNPLVASLLHDSEDRDCSVLLSAAAPSPCPGENASAAARTTPPLRLIYLPPPHMVVRMRKN